MVDTGKPDCCGNDCPCPPNGCTCSQDGKECKNNGNQNQSSTQDEGCACGVSCRCATLESKHEGCGCNN